MRSEAQLAQVLELSIVQSYDNIHAQIALMQQNEQAMDVIQRDIGPSIEVRRN